MKTKRFPVTIEVIYRATNIEIAERDVKEDLDKIFDPSEYTAHVGNPDAFAELAELLSDGPSDPPEND